MQESNCSARLQVVVIVAIDPAHTSRLEGLAIKNSIVITKLGTTGGDALTINDAVISN
jgi:phosphoribosylformylglycinamidine synthase